MPEDAKVILINDVAPQHHSICPEGDADWVRFFGRAGKEYTIRTSNLGPGLDTFMFLFDSDAATILAQNDDGGDGVASRIDFFPQRDAWYFVQVKNAGDLGLPEMTYDLSLQVVPGVPQPPGTATPIIAPIETVTEEPGVPSPTTFVQPTQPPLPTPTQGVIPPTPADVVPTKVVPPPVATDQVPAPTEKPTEIPTEAVVPTEPPPAPTPSEGLPGVPKTGGVSPGQTSGKDPLIVTGPPAIPAAPPPPASESLAPVLFRVFYDANKDDTFDSGEGIRGVSVFFLDANNNLAPTGSLTTGQTGELERRADTSHPAACVHSLLRNKYATHSLP